MHPSDRFVKLLNKFVVELEETFPEDGTALRSYREKNLQSVDDTAAFTKHFMKCLQPLSKGVQERDASRFTPGSLMLDAIDMHHILSRSMSEQNRKAIWQYLQLLLIVGTMATSQGDSAEAEQLLRNMQKGSPSVEKSTSDSDGETSFIEDLAKDIAQEIKLPDDIDSQNPFDVIQSILSGSGNFGKIMGKVGEKLQKKMETGELNEQVLLNESQALMNKMSKMSTQNGGPDISDIMQKMTAGGADNDGLMNMMQNMFANGGQGTDLGKIMQNLTSGADASSLANMMQSMFAGSSSDNAQTGLTGMLTNMMKGGDSMPDLEEIQKKVKKNMRQEYLNAQAEHQSPAAKARKEQLKQRMAARKKMLADLRK